MITDRFAKTILVTGGTGFLGRHVVWRLSQLGYATRFTGRDAQQADLVRARCANAATFIPLDHRHDDVGAILAQAGQGCAGVVHTAALSAPWGAQEDFYRINVGGTEDVVASCHVNGIGKLVHISTPSLYFDFTHRHNIKESDPLPPPVNDYAATKALAERIVLASDVSSRVILRPRALFGAWDRTLMPRLMRLMNRGVIPMPNAGKALVDLTYIDNAVDAILLALEKDTGPQPRIYNVSNGTPVTVKCLLQNVLHVLGGRAWLVPTPYGALDRLAAWMERCARQDASGREPLLTRYSAGVLAFDQTLDLTSIQRDLGYAAAVGWEEGLRCYAAWLREEGRAS